MKKLKILFQGDSITDDNRERTRSGLGLGYARFAADMLRNKYPDVEFEFVNRGVSGNKTADLLARVEDDIIKVDPDIISILIGINDVWHYAEEKNWLPNEEFEANYRAILEAVKRRTHAKLIIMEPFLFPHAHMQFMREDLDFKIDVIRKLALEYADAYLPTDGLFYSVYLGQDPTVFSPDGIHPDYEQGPFIARKYCETAMPIIEKLIRK